MERYQDIFYTPLLSDWRNFETWKDDGAVVASQRANKIWKSLLEEYVPPEIDQGVVEELNEFVQRRKNGNFERRGKRDSPTSRMNDIFRSQE